MWLYRIAFALVALFAASCSVLAQPTPTPTPTPTETPTITPSPSNTPTITPIPPTETPSSTPEPTLTPSPIPTETPIPTPTRAPDETVFFTYDQWEQLNLSSDLGNRLSSPMIAFLNTNNRTGSAATPRPGNNVETLYYVSPTNSAGRIAIHQFDASTAGQIYIAPGGDAFAYMRFDAGMSANGLYIANLNLETPITGRVLPIQSLTQRGIFNPPSWKPDGTQIAIAVASGYDIDIYTITRGGSWAPVVSQGSYDFWPVWSPDGNYLAFVSDRVSCPSWRPGEPGTCDGTAAIPPSGGHVFILEVATGTITQISDVVVYEPPRWATPRQITFAVGDPLFGDPERSLFIADIFSGDVRSVRLSNGDVPLKLAEFWSPSGQQVLFQEADSTTTDIVLAQTTGVELGRISDLTFSRYGMSASWSPDGSLIAIGGVGGQCPYGIVVADTTLNTIARGNPPPTMCEPTYSPDGRWLAFTGIIPNRDGRVDVYAANQNGFGAVNLTGSLLGNIDMIGWVGG